MAERFNLTAVLQLQAPGNTAQVINQIKKDLGKLGVDVKINADTRSLAAVQGQLKKVDKSARSSAKGMGLLGRNISEAARRFSVITIATGSFIALARAMKNSVGSAISFQREMVKISQVTDKSLNQLSGLSKEVTRLSTSLGVANKSLLETSRILAQAGFTALKTKQALEILANTTLAPSFDNIIDTTEGAIAIINQFGREAMKTGSEIQFLENSLDAINQVSKTFAVESKDLITAVRRTGGVFEAAGGKLNELIALFTSVRQTTRESAETIATGFRTIFTRLQRSETIAELEKLGISLSDVEGKFIGPLRAIEALSVGLAGLDPRDVRFNEIVEQLGGFRQIGKVIPLIKQYAVATQALSVANTSAGSTSRDAETAQQALAVQFQKVVQQFDALIRKFSESETFKGMAETILTLATTFLKFAESLEKVLPLLTAVAAIKIGRSLGPGLAGLFGGGKGRGKQYGGVVRGFSGGGFVPGTGSRDTVPAMLQPGEFVVKKSSAKKLGPDQLRSMNQNRFGKGGKLVSGRGATEASHIGGPIKISKKDVQAILASKDMKFRRSYVANVLGKKMSTLYKGGKDAGNTEVNRLYNEASKSNVTSKFLREKMKLSAKTDVMLNLPLSYNQALRESDANLVSKKGLASWMKRGKNLFGSLPPPLEKAIRASGSIGKLRTDLSSFVAGPMLPALQPGHKQGKIIKNPTNKAAYDSDPELNPLKAELKNRLQAIEGPTTQALFKSMEVFFKASGMQRLSDLGTEKKGRTSTERAGIKRAFGGLVQRFAMGGIAKVNKIGAAILDPDMGMAKESIPVGIKDVQAAIKGSGSEPSLVKKNLGKAYKGKTYNLSRQGLNKKTSDGFKRQIVEGLGVGLDHATGTLGADLGLGSSKMDPGSRQEFQNYISKRPVVGDLFESALQSLGTAGKFTEAAVSAPFDFPGGLSGKLKDNYSNLPKSFIDAKSSYAAASTAGMKGKIVNELVKELKRSGEYTRLSKPMKKAARGGGISGKDSVPSLLTPGEFVVKKSAAQSIGYSNLKRMNDTGVARFHDGGVAGIAGAGKGGAEAFRLMGGAGVAQFFKELPKAAIEMVRFVKTNEQAQAAIIAYSRSITRGETEIEALAAASTAASKHLKGIKSPRPTGGGGGGGGGGVIDAQLAPKKGVKWNKFQKGLDKTAGVLGKFQSGLSGVSSALIGFTFIAGTLIQSSNSLSDAQKEQEQAGLSAVGAWGALGAEVLSFGLMLGAATLMMGKNLIMKAKETVVSAVSTVTEGAESVGNVVAATTEGVESTANLASASASSIFTLALYAAIAPLVIIAAFMGGTWLYAIYDTSKALKALEQATERQTKAADEQLTKLRETGAADEEEFVRSTAGASISTFNKSIVEATASAREMDAAMDVGWGAAIGGWIGNMIVPGAGGIIGAGIGGAATATEVPEKLEKDREAAIKANEQMARVIGTTTAEFARATWKAVASIKAFDAAMSTAEKANLNASQTLGVLTVESTALREAFVQNESSVAEAEQRLQELADTLKKKGVLDASGQEVELGTDAEPEEKEIRAKDLKALEQAEKARITAIKEQNARLKDVLAREAQIRSQMNQVVGEAVEKMAAEGGDLSELTSFAKIVEKLGIGDKITKALIEVNAIIDLEFQKAIEAAGDNLLLAGYYEDLRDLRKKEAEQGSRLQLQERTLATQKATAAMLQSEIAERAKQRAIDRTNAALKGFNIAMIMLTGKVASLDASLAILEGGTPDAAKFDTRALETPLEQIDPFLLSNALDDGLSALMGSVDPAVRKAAEEMKKKVMLTQSLISNMAGAWQDVLGQKIPIKDKDITALGNKLFDDLEKALGGIKIGKDMAPIIRRKIAEQLEIGPIDTSFINDLKSSLEQMTEAEKKVALRGIEIQNQYLERLSQVNDAIIKSQNRQAELQGRLVDSQERNASRIAKAARQPRNRIAERMGRDAAAQGRLTQFAQAGPAPVVAGNVDATARALEHFRQAAKDAAEAAAAATTKEDKARLSKISKENADAAKQATKELERLADKSAELAAVEAELTKVQEEKGQIGAIVEDIAFGSDEERFNLGQAFNDLQTAMQQGGIQGANEKQRANVARALDMVDKVKIGPQGQTGRQIKAQMAEQEALALNIAPEIAAQIRENVMAGSEEEQLIAEMRQIAADEAAAIAALIAAEEANRLALVANTEAYVKQFDDAIEAGQGLGPGLPGTEEQEAKDQELAERHTALVLTIGTLTTATDLLRVDYEATRAEIAGLTEAIRGVPKAETRGNYTGEAVPGGRDTRTSGGPGMATGGSIFTARGSDTVPAMLTPGEFVMRKSAVDKYGVGFMRQINRGAAGFNQGGHVQYRALGGGIGGRRGGGLDAMMTQFSGFSTAVGNLASAIQGGMTLTHDFTGNLALAFKIENAGPLATAVASAITPRLSEIITEEIDKKIKFLKDNP